MFTAINTTEIETGKPVATTTQTKIKDNFDDHEERIQDLEAFAVGDPPIIFRVNGHYGVKTGVLKTTTNLSLLITGVRLIIDTAGSAGTTEIDIKRKRGGGSYESIFSTLPSVAFGAGSDATSSNGVIDTSKDDFIAGDLLRLDITSTQTGGLGFMVRIDFERD